MNERCAHSGRSSTQQRRSDFRPSHWQQTKGTICAGRGSFEILGRSRGPAGATSPVRPFVKHAANDRCQPKLPVVSTAARAKSGPIAERRSSYATQKIAGLLWRVKFAGEHSAVTQLSLGTQNLTFVFFFKRFEVEDCPSNRPIVILRHLDITPMRDLHTITKKTLRVTSRID